jgi:hypothetical protein
MEWEIIKNINFCINFKNQRSELSIRKSICYFFADLKVQLPPLDSFDSKIQVEEVVEIEISGEVSKGELLIICMCFLRMSFLLINVKK